MKKVRSEKDHFSLFLLRSTFLKVVTHFIVAESAFLSQAEESSENRHGQSVFTQISSFGVVRRFIVAKTAFPSQFR